MIGEYPNEITWLVVGLVSRDTPMFPDFKSLNNVLHFRLTCGWIVSIDKICFNILTVCLGKNGDNGHDCDYL